ncbi:hypothetical protein [Pseudomonas syringae]|nr:hypothetical protein [Pseudomonas syringae]
MLGQFLVLLLQLACMLIELLDLDQGPGGNIAQDIRERHRAVKVSSPKLHWLGFLAADDSAVFQNLLKAAFLRADPAVFMQPDQDRVADFAFFE